MPQHPKTPPRHTRSTSNDPCPMPRPPALGCSWCAGPGFGWFVATPHGVLGHPHDSLQSRAHNANTIIANSNKQSAQDRSKLCAPTPTSGSRRPSRAASVRSVPYLSLGTCTNPHSTRNVHGFTRSRPSCPSVSGDSLLGACA